MVKPITIRTVLSLAVSFNWPLRQFDVSNAFLHDNFSETVYIPQPLGFSHSQHPHVVCKLQNAIYGLKQALRFGFSQLRTRLFELSFYRSNSDSSLFMYQGKDV